MRTHVKAYFRRKESRRRDMKRRRIVVEVGKCKFHLLPEEATTLAQDLVIATWRERRVS